MATGLALLGACAQLELQIRNVDHGTVDWLHKEYAYWT